MNRSFIFITTAICVSCLSACDTFKDKYDAGYDDGWAAGYNTTCKIRATMIEGDPFDAYIPPNVEDENEESTPHNVSPTNADTTH